MIKYERKKHILKKIARTILDILLVYSAVAFAIKAALLFGPMMDFWKKRVFKRT